jgi:hypothetical protein
VALSGTVVKADQVITFPRLPVRKTTDAPFELDATGGDSGSPITFSSSNPDVASVSGKTVTIHDNGETTITADQAGTQNFNPAPPVAHTLTVEPPRSSFSSQYPGTDPNESVGGVPALLVYALNGSKTGENTKILPQPEVLDGGVQITFLARTDDPSIEISAQGSLALNQGWDAPVSKVAGVDQSGVPDNFERQTWRLNATGTGFLRVRVVQK